MGKPVIFLAFANDREGFLHNLGVEQRKISDALDKASAAGLCEVVQKSSVTVKTIFNVFQQYRNRIAIFHYGGHADDYTLLLESEEGDRSVAHSEGLVSALARQNGLQLVFINGCSSKHQAQELIRANIPAVVGTAQPIDDAVATDLAERFYLGLAEGATIDEAWAAAVDQVMTQIKEAGKELSIRALSWAGKETRINFFPWDIYYRQGAEEVKAWNLPQAAGDPLFGLPPIPISDLPEKPFRHLHWFEREHAEVFFGRHHQIRALYERVIASHTAPIILLHGQSGVGKSSLLAAGLMPRLEGTHEIYYRRRDQKLGLLGTLNQALLPNAKESSLAEAWLALEQQRNRPLLVILDQVEEVYTRPNREQPNEWQEFLEALQATFADPSHRPQGKLILGFRKEWLAEIDKRLSENRLSRSAVFLESLDRRGIIEAIIGPSRSERLRSQFGLTIEAGLPEIIADDLLEDRDSPIAPTLQILLTKMWDEAKKRNYSQPRFDLDLYQTLKKQGILLKDFLDQQFDKLRQGLPEVVNSGLALEVLAFHTTPQRTAEQRTKAELEQEYEHQKQALPALVQQCQDLYLLVDAATKAAAPESATRLAHDTLAHLVRQQFDESDKPGQRAHRILENRSVEWRDGQQGTPLDERDLAVVEHGEKGMRARKSDEQRLIEASRKRKAQKQRNRKILQWTGFIAVLLIVFVAILAYFKQKEAERQTRIATARSIAVESQAVRTNFPQRSVLLAVEAINLAWRAHEPHTSTAENAFRASLASIGGQRLAGHEGKISAVAISADNHWLVTGSWDKTARLWDLTAKNPAANPVVLAGHESNISAVAISADNHWLVTGSWDKTARLWDLTAKNPAANPVVLAGHEGSIEAVAISADNHWLVTGSGDNTARLWDLTDKNLAANPVVLAGHEGGIIAVAISADNHWLVTGSGDNTARLWDLTDKNLAANPVVLAGQEGGIFAVAISANNHWLVTGSGNTARLWDLTAQNPATNPVVLAGHEYGITAVAISADNYWLVTGSWDKTARLWDLTAKNPAANPVVLAGHEGGIFAVAISADNHWLVTGSGDNTARLWDLTAKNPAANPVVLAGHEGGITAVDISADNHWLVTGSWDKTARLWDLTAKNPAANPVVLAGHEGVIFSVAISADNHWLVTGSGDNTARLWDLTAKNPAANPVVLAGHEYATIAVAISADNHWLVTGSGDKTARLWDLTAKNPAAKPVVLVGHEGGINAVAISADNHWLVTGSDKTPRLWDLTAKNPAANSVVLAGHEDIITAIAISADNHWLLTGSNDNTARLWNLRLNELIDLACRTAGRNFYYSEWQQYFPGEPYCKICPDLPIHPSFIEYGRNLAKNGDMDGAIKIFKRAKELDPSLDLDPKAEAQKLATERRLKK